MNQARAIQERDRRVVAPAIYRLTSIVFSHGAGGYVYDTDGRRYLDLAAGVATCAVGHCHPGVVRAIQEQAARFIHPNNHLGIYAPYSQLLSAVLAHAPGPLAQGKGLLVNSGTEAIEAGLKLARYVTGRAGVLSCLGGFHGRGMGALAVTGSSAAYRRGFTGLLSGVVHAPFPAAGRPLYPGTDPAAAEALAIEAVEGLLRTVLPPEDLAAVIVEPIQGEGGYYVPTSGWLPYLRRLCDRTGALLIADEVQTGLGRTGRWFGVEHWGVVPDVICLGKAFGGGLPLGGVLAGAELLDRWPAGAHGSTFGGNPLACRASLATLEIIEREGLVARAAELGERMRGWLREGAKRLPQVAEVRGLGLMIGVELRRADGSPAVAETSRCIEAAAGRGLLVTKCGTHTIRIAPALNLPEEDARAGVERLLESIEQSFGAR